MAKYLNTTAVVGKHATKDRLLAELPKATLIHLGKCSSLAGLAQICDICFLFVSSLKVFHTLRVHYAHAAANLNSGYSKYAKVARVHYFCTIALRTSRAVVTRA